VVEQDKPGFVSSTSNSVAVTVLSGQATQVDFGDLQLDFGDAPASYGIASSSIGSLWLGASVSAEASSKFSAQADADNFDDGVIMTPGVTWSKNLGGASIDVSITGGSGYLAAWIDGDNNGAFDGSELALMDLPVSAGTHTFTFSLPADVNLNNDFIVRFRIYPDSSTGTASPAGFSANGEVEDYSWGQKPTAVTLKNFDARSEGFNPIWLLIAGLPGAGLLLLSTLKRK
jgi:hypothetical protein